VGLGRPFQVFSLASKNLDCRKAGSGGVMGGAPVSGLTGPKLKKSSTTKFRVLWPLSSEHIHSKYMATRATRATKNWTHYSIDVVLGNFSPFQARGISVLSI
jgi:hypothetical protein